MAGLFSEGVFGVAPAGIGGDPTATPTAEVGAPTATTASQPAPEDERAPVLAAINAGDAGVVLTWLRRSFQNPDFERAVVAALTGDAPEVRGFLIAWFSEPLPPPGISTPISTISFEARMTAAVQAWRRRKRRPLVVGGVIAAGVAGWWWWRRRRRS